MASGERVSLTYAKRDSGRLKLDLSPFVPPVRVTDGSSGAIALPFVLFLHGGLHLTGSRHDVPPWLIQMCRLRGIPLLSADYRLAPHATPADAAEDVADAWSFIGNELEWIIAAAGSGAEVESGTKYLEENWEQLQRHGGVDPKRGVIVAGPGAGGYLAALAGAQLSPPPLALVLNAPLLTLPSVTPAQPTSDVDAFFTPELLAEGIDKAQHVVPDVPALLRGFSSEEMAKRSLVGCDVRTPWLGQAEAEKREGFVEALKNKNALFPYLAHLSRDSVDVPSLVSGQTSSSSPLNSPFPATLIMHGTADALIPPRSSSAFLSALRSSDANAPAAALDALVTPISAPSANDSSAPGTLLEELEPTRRFASLFVRGAGHAFDAVAFRDDEKWGEAIRNVDTWLAHWMGQATEPATKTFGEVRQRL